MRSFCRGVSGLEDGGRLGVLFGWSLLWVWFVECCCDGVNVVVVLVPAGVAVRGGDGAILVLPSAVSLMFALL